MSHKRLTNRLIVLLVLEVLFEFGMVNFSRYLHENSSVLFLCLDKFLFLGLLILLNNWLTQRKIPFSLKLNKDQQKGILVVAGILIIMGLMNVKNFLNAIAVGFIAGTTEEYLFRGVVLLTLLELFDHFQYLVWFGAFSESILAKFFGNNNPSFADDGYGICVC
ncbi:hypothetical protein [Bombilactobacillus thymidiniphilus]|uniref:CAAX prenyl protease-like protein n=1 Tax=Bombilactobacillus thymidiniphilus TaxID=2923363 RepID=A0ABY4PD39_9LACO|nr:hypothetical protein [Bombilactobacillus thymidiniphilus]UQS83606.1 hypothetical protein MOO47_07535 [Bombilactobacillus thymidiniphilus]UQS83621.1 hypothetical protein MOO47_07610 [Bombilactobacillus thymidiniphilus]UQS83626.1 hypothetical protein MOO47_00020 [Bombilactobacillus thymidiniphilus]UQS83641.1 hypothetical protein MOO47_00095 [Bombilactobacillus thymidiniphilus]